MPLVLDSTAEPKTHSPAPAHVTVRSGAELDRWLSAVPRPDLVPQHPSTSLLWLPILREGLAHEPFLLEAAEDGRTTGYLPLALVKSALFGRFLVSLPYVNTSGLHTTSPAAEPLLIERAVQLADELDVRYLEIRHVSQIAHPSLAEARSNKVLMRLKLPQSADALWNSFKSKLRSQIRSGEKHAFDVAFGRHDRLDDFYAVFSRNMRDLGTPVFPKRLFAAILNQFSEAAECCIVRLKGQPVAAALLLHGRGTTEVPSASSLREYNSTNANMVLYWNLLKRAVERGQQAFDFGRSTMDSNTFRFKKQWGAEPSPSVWQYYVRRGTIGDLRPDNARFKLAISAWRRLPLVVANWIGPLIVRGIP